MSDGSALDNPLLVREEPASGGYRIGIATLNAPRSLNALTLPMIRALSARVREWALDPKIACIYLEGMGERAFCAGGDVRALREAILAYSGRPPNPMAQEFFAEEYRLDYRIHKLEKPIIVWGSGAVMGGGLGLFAGASHRLVTEASRIAMPEISIGLYPDVGASWFLQGLPRRTGLFLALTGAPLNGADACVVGLADLFTRASDRSDILTAIARVSWTESARVNHTRLSEALRPFGEHPASARPPSNIERHGDTIERATQGRNFAQIVKSVKSLCDSEDAWLVKAAATLSAGSPTSAALIWETRRRAQHLSLAAVFRMELIVSLQCCAHPDFPEGVRALLIDKDNAPQWTPATSAEVSSEWLNKHFVTFWPPGMNQSHPLDDLNG